MKQYKVKKVYNKTENVEESNKGGEPTTTEPTPATIESIKKELDELKVEYKDDATKEELEKLLADAQKGSPDAETAEKGQKNEY